MAGRALAAWGHIALSNRAVRFISATEFDGNRNKLWTGQIGGGLTPYDSLPLYTEFYGGLQGFDPVLSLSDGITTLAARAKWRSLSVAGGFGWDFRLSENWTLRPIVNLSYGRVESEVSTIGAVPPAKSGADLAFLARGELNAADHGGSLELEYRLREAAREYDFFLRHTEMKLETVGSSSASAAAEVSGTSAFFRARYPIGNWQALGRPVRSVWQAGLTALHGDQADALGIDWVASVGAGIELDVEDTPLPLVTRTRLMVSISKSNSFTAYSVGLGLSF